MSRAGGGIWTLALVGLLIGTGCGPDERLEAQRARLELEQEERMAALERIEARLVQSKNLTAMWRDLGHRHGEISEIACEQVSGHAEALARHEQRTIRRKRDLARLAQFSAEQRPELESSSN